MRVCFVYFLSGLARNWLKIADDGIVTTHHDQSMYSVSQKTSPTFLAVTRKHCRIFIMFGTHVTEKVSNQ